MSAFWEFPMHLPTHVGTCELLLHCLFWQFSLYSCGVVHDRDLLAQEHGLLEGTFIYHLHFSNNFAI